MGTRMKATTATFSLSWASKAKTHSQPCAMPWREDDSEAKIYESLISLTPRMQLAISLRLGLNASSDGRATRRRRIFTKCHSVKTKRRGIFTRHRFVSTRSPSLAAISHRRTTKKDPSRPESRLGSSRVPFAHREMLHNYIYDTQSRFVTAPATYPSPTLALRHTAITNSKTELASQKEIVRFC